MIPLKSYDGKERRKEVSDFRKAFKKLGMQTTLAELIGLCDSDGDCVKQLKTDLEATLKNYMKRHDKENKDVPKKKTVKKEMSISLQISAANARVTNTPVSQIRLNDGSRSAEYPPSGRE